MTYLLSYDGNETEHNSISDALNSIGHGEWRDRAISHLKDHDEYTAWAGNITFTLSKKEDEYEE